MKREDSEESLVERLSNEPNEEEIEQFHVWIEQVCDPDDRFETGEIFDKICNDVTKSAERTKEELKQKSKEFVSNLAKTLTDSNEQKLQLHHDGPFCLRGSGDAILEGAFTNGLPHGFFRKINEFGDVEFWGCFVDGKLHGTCWKTLVGGGFLLSSSIDFSGEEMAYLYPDGRTALVGTFEKEKMINGCLTEVIGTSRACFLTSGSVDPDETVIDGLTPSSTCPCYKVLMKPKFSRPQPFEFHYDPSTTDRISSDPLLRDPYESLFVRLGPSHLPHAGQGLFAADDITPATVVAFYNGIKIKEDKNNNDLRDLEDEDEDWTCYRLNLTDEIVIDIPREMASTQNYCASLGHKICHSFTPNCQFEDFYHPRFGEIKCIVTMTSILQGEELTANYEYKLADAPIWYKKLWAKHQKQIRKLPDWNTALRCRNSKTSLLSTSPTTGRSSTSTSSSRTISESRTPDTIPEVDNESDEFEE